MPLIYNCLIEDDRYTVPTLTFVAAASDDRMRELAREMLDSSRHYLSVDVALGDVTMFTVQVVREPTLQAA